MKVNVVSPWYPDRSLGQVYSGAFVQKQVQALQKSGVEVSVEVPKIYRHPYRTVPASIDNALLSMAKLKKERVFREVGEATIIPSAVPKRSSMLQRVKSIERYLKLKRSIIPVTSQIEHAHVALPCAAALLQIAEAPLVITEHSSHVRHECQIPEVAELYREVIRSADIFICVSSFLQNEISELLDLEVSSSWHVIPNIVDFSLFPFKERNQYEYRSWVYVGALLESKGVTELLKVFHHYKVHHDFDVELTLVGKGPLEGWIRSYCKRNGIVDVVKIEEPVPPEDLHLIYSESDLMVHLSPYETFGIVSLEAIANGLPVVSLRNGGSQDTWEDVSSICGLLLDKSSSISEISDAINSWRSSPETLNLREASEIIRSRFSPEIVTKSLIEIYKGLN